MYSKSPAGSGWDRTKWWELSFPTFLCWCKSVQDHWSWWRLCLFISLEDLADESPPCMAGKYCLTGKIPLPMTQNLNGEGKELNSSSRANSHQIRQGSAPSTAAQLNWGCQNISYGVLPTGVSFLWASPSCRLLSACTCSASGEQDHNKTLIYGPLGKGDAAWIPSRLQSLDVVPGTAKESRAGSQQKKKF